VENDLYELRLDGAVRRFTTSREMARERTDVELLGLDHPIVERALAEYRALPPEEIGVVVEGESQSGVLTFWQVESHGTRGEKRIYLQGLGVGLQGERSVALERCGDSLFGMRAAAPVLERSQRQELLSDHIEPMLRRELLHRGIISEEKGYSADLVGWIEIVAQAGGGREDARSNAGRSVTRPSGQKDE
jgi:hypothetical protein